MFTGTNARTTEISLRKLVRPQGDSLQGNRNESSVGEATWLMVGLQRNRGSISCRGKNLTCSPKRPARF